MVKSERKFQKIVNWLAIVEGVNWPSWKARDFADRN
jgi:hypothetical protein